MLMMPGSGEMMSGIKLSGECRDVLSRNEEMNRSEMPGVQSLPEPESHSRHFRSTEERR
jgi:hypothetical protein